MPPPIQSIDFLGEQIKKRILIQLESVSVEYSMARMIAAYQRPAQPTITHTPGMVVRMNLAELTCLKVNTTS